MLVYQSDGLQPARSGGTYAVTGNADVSSGLDIELKPTPFNKPGIWTVMTWTGTLTGTAQNVNIINSTTSLNAPLHPYQDGNSFKVVLS
jgi:hypothetical protein